MKIVNNYDRIIYKLNPNPDEFSMTGDESMNMKKDFKKAFELGPEAIDRTAEEVYGILSDFHVERKTALRARLLIEELLVNILKNLEGPVICSFSFKRRFENGSILIRYEGEPYDPLLQENTDEYTALLLENLGLPCKWAYKNNENTLFLSVRNHRKNGTGVLLASIGAAVLFGLASRMLPEVVIQALSDYLLTPFRTAFLGLLNAFACFLIFFSLISGLCGEKGAESLGITGRKIIARQLIVVVLITILSYLFLLPFHDLTFGTLKTPVSSQAARISELLWGIVPDSVLTPFTKGNYIQIVVLALVFGLALSAVKDQHPELTAVISSINSLLMTVTGKLCRLIPLFIFCSIFSLIRSPVTAGSLTDIWKPVVMFLAAGALFTGISFGIMTVRYKCNGMRIFRYMIPAVLIALTTGSPVAAYSTNLDILENRFGISRRFSRVGLAVSSKLYLPGVSLYIAVMVAYFAEKYRTPIGAGWLLTALLLTILLTYACPPIPASFLVIFGVIAGQLGFPEECMLLLVTADVIMDGLSSALCCILRNAELIFEASCYKEMESDILKTL